MTVVVPKLWRTPRTGEPCKQKVQDMTGVTVTDRNGVARPALIVAVEEAMREAITLSFDKWLEWYEGVLRNILDNSSRRHSRIAGLALIEALNHVERDPSSSDHLMTVLRAGALGSILIPWVDPGSAEVARAVMLLAERDMWRLFKKIKQFFGSALPCPVPSAEWLASMAERARNIWWVGEHVQRLTSTGALRANDGVLVAQKFMQSAVLFKAPTPDRDAPLSATQILRLILRGTRAALEIDARALLANCVAKDDSMRSWYRWHARVHPIAFQHAIAVYTDQVRRARRFLGGTRRRAVAHLGKRYGLPHDVQRMVWRALVRPDWALLRVAQSRARMARVDDDDE